MVTVNFLNPNRQFKLRFSIEYTLSLDEMYSQLEEYIKSNDLEEIGLFPTRARFIQMAQGEIVKLIEQMAEIHDLRIYDLFEAYMEDGWTIIGDPDFEEVRRDLR